MAIYLGDKKVSGNARISSLPLFYHTPQDHLLNDVSWLRADTYSWHLADVYMAAYAHLVKDINGKTAQTETVAGITITYYRADDDHKIILPDQILNADLIYNATGISWYFILDTTNKRFKLPRNKYAYTGFKANINDKAGDYVAPTTANLTAGSDMVQQPAIQTYLYFYVGNTIQNESSLNVGQLTEAINNKQDKLIAGNNITIIGNTISASNAPGLEWGNISGTISNQTDLLDKLNQKMGSPSARYIDLTLAASGSNYVAPANGWFSFAKASTAQTQTSTANIYYNSTLLYRVNGEYHNAWIVPVKKDFTLNLIYSLGGNTQLFRFIYAEGEE